MFLDGSGMICTISRMFPGSDLYYTDPEQHLVGGRLGCTLDYLDRDLSDLLVRRVEMAYHSVRIRKDRLIIVGITKCSLHIRTERYNSYRKSHGIT